MTGYTTHDVANLLGLSDRQIRSYARSGFLKPARGPRGEYLFTFQDLVVLRTAAELVAGRVPKRTITRALRKLRAQLPQGRSLTEVRISAEGAHVVVSDGTTSWNPESGQLHFSFDVAELAARAEPIARRRAATLIEQHDFTAHEWFELALDLESVAPDEARQAYARVLELDPRHPDAHVNLGRLLHEEGRITEAATHYLQALRRYEEHATAAFNLGVAMEDLGRLSEAIKAYEQCVAADAHFADAHFNLARVYEKIGNKRGAIRHLTKYRGLAGEH